MKKVNEWRISTEQLLLLVRFYNGQQLKASLRLQGGIVSTHTLRWHRGRLLDEGCDFRTHRTSMKQFKEDYLAATWVIYYGQLNRPK
jgi:hypothetical protein